MRRGVQRWDRDHGYALSKGRAPDAVSNAAMRLTALLQQVSLVKRNLVNGARTPQWLLELISLWNGNADLGKRAREEEEEEESSDENDDAEHTPSGHSNAIVPVVARTLPTKTRRVLKKLDTTDSEASTKSCPVMLTLAPAKQSSAPAKRAATLHWFSVAEETAFRNIGTGAVTCATEVRKDHPSAMLEFVWPDGDRWLSEEPVLDAPSSGEPGVARRPAAAPERRPPPPPPGPVVRRPSTGLKSDAWKLEHSKVYHGARKEYKELCAANGTHVVDAHMNKFCQEEWAQAKLIWFG